MAMNTQQITFISLELLDPRPKTQAAGGGHRIDRRAGGLDLPLYGVELSIRGNKEVT